MGDMRMYISQADHDAIIAASVKASTVTNASDGAHDRSTAASALASTRRGQPAAAAIPAMGMASGAAAVTTDVTAKSATKAKTRNPPPTPLTLWP